jgi:hypothetical protein
MIVFLVLLLLASVVCFGAASVTGNVRHVAFGLMTFALVPLLQMAQRL